MQLEATVYVTSCNDKWLVNRKINGMVNAALGSVDELTDSENDAPARKEIQGIKRHCPSGSASSLFKPIDELTESSSDHAADFRELGLRKRRKRRKLQPRGPTPRQRLVSDIHCKAALGKFCKGCNRPCLSIFQSGQLNKDFKKFRQIWNQTHKLDQDKIALKPGIKKKQVAWETKSLKGIVVIYLEISHSSLFVAAFFLELMFKLECHRFSNIPRFNSKEVLVKTSSESILGVL